MVKFAEAEARMFHRVFVCKKCSTKLKAPVLKVAEKKVACRKCGCKALRPVRKK
jgi:ribosomal protein L40E